MTEITRWMPREHGAWAQLVFPALTVAVLAGPTLPGALLMLAAFAAFMLHEPLTVLSGGRGVRKREAEGADASRFVRAIVPVAAMAGLLALVLLEGRARLLVLAPLLPVAVLVGLMLRGRDKTTAGELVAAFAFAVLALPVAAAADRPEMGTLVATCWALCFTLSTLTIRAVTVKAHGKRDPSAQRRAAHHARLGALLGLSTLVLGAGLVAAGRLPAAVMGGVAPFALFSIVCWRSPPRPVHRRRVGWGLAACCLLTFTVLAIGLRI